MNKLTPKKIFTVVSVDMDNIVNKLWDEYSMSVEDSGFDYMTKELFKSAVNKLLNTKPIRAFSENKMIVFIDWLVNSNKLDSVSASIIKKYIPEYYNNKK